MKRVLLIGLFVVGLFWALGSYQGLAGRGEFDRLVLDFREDIPAAQVQATLTQIDREYGVQPQLNSEFSEGDRLYVMKGDRALLKALRREIAGSVEYVEPDYIYTTTYKTADAPNDPDYDKQWNFRNISVEPAWTRTKGKDVVVAVIDTGVSQVPDLKETKFVPGYDFVGDRIDATDDNGHGTHVAGTIAQSTNNSYGVTGIAYEASIMPLKVLSKEGGGTIADIAEAIKFAADNGAGVINMSLGGAGESELMQEAIDYAYGKGVVVVAAAGNANQNAASYPARYPKVIGVAATDATDVKAPYSNFGAGVDIAAPGGAITQESDRGGILQNTIDPQTGKSVFKAFQGTSMAAPHVAGVAALVRGMGVESPEEVLEILKQSARPVSEDPLNHFGAGHLNAEAAVNLAAEGRLDARDFFRWLRDNGYLNPRFWIDGGAVALLPKILMVIGSYLLAWLLRKYFPFGFGWNGHLTTGLILGSSGFFFLRGLYVFDLPQFPFRVLGSSIPELGTAIQGNSALNPIFASVAIPVVLILLLLGHSQWRWFAIGTSLGMASCLAVSAIADPSLVWLGSGMAARLFLGINALLCFGLARLVVKPEAAI